MDSRTYRSAPLVRLFKIVTLLYGGGKLTQRDLAAACDCSERQIRRDLVALGDADVPISYDPKLGYLLDPHWSPLRLTLTLHEVLALLLARQAVTGRSDLPFAHSARTAFDKVAALLPESLRGRFEEDQMVAYSGGAKRQYGAAPWGTLIAAIRQRESLEMRYYTIGRDQTSERRIDPYHIVWLQDYCHLIGYCHTRRKVLNFAMDGILEIRPAGVTFETAADFSLAAYIKGASGPMLGDPVEIAVRFDAELARWAKRRVWGFPHTLADQTDGSLLLKGTVRGLTDIRKELLTWGKHVLVLEPAKLRDEIRDEALAIVALYARPENN